MANVIGQEVTVLTVDYEPGAVSEPHVRRGSVVSQLEGGQPVTYTQGQSWYESPKTPHVLSKNASRTEPAKLLIFLLSQEARRLRLRYDEVRHPIDESGHPFFNRTDHMAMMMHTEWLVPMINGFPDTPMK